MRLKELVKDVYRSQSGEHKFLIKGNKTLNHIDSILFVLMNDWVIKWKSHMTMQSADMQISTS